MIIYRRIIATVIDLVIAGIAATAVGLYINSPIQTILFKTVFFYLLHTSIILFSSKKYTLGEEIMGIRVVSVLQKDLSVLVLILRNLIFCFYLILIALTWGRPFEFILFIMLFLSLNSLIFIKNPYDHPMTGIDYLFKSFYIQYPTK